VKVLVVEDEAPTAAFLRRGLTEEGFAVDVAPNAASADEHVEEAEYDLILLDVMLPGADGFTLCKRWRADGVTTPILFLTARDDVADRIRGLDRGGDDYLVKPFAFGELLARVRALLRRPRAMTGSPELQVADLVLDTARRRATRGGRPIELTTREYQLLEHLVRNAGKVVSRTALWEHVWETGSEPDSNVVDVYVRYLRNKLGRDPDLIRTVRSGGYVLEGTPEPRDRG
jgi:two-component system, OmpR family, copper resistance phosphate regulon response regulator CusR